MAEIQQDYAPEQTAQEPDLTESVQTKGICVFICLTGSIIEFATAANQCDLNDHCGEHKYGWAIAVGVLSTMLCMLRLLLLKVKPDLPDKLDMLFSFLLVGGWIFGAAFNTRAGNGWFSTWIALLCALYYAYLSFLPVQEKLQREVASQNIGLVTVCVSSLILMAASADHCSQDGIKCNKKNAYAVAVGVISLFICVIMMALLRSNRCPPLMNKFVPFFLVALWSSGCAVSTSTHGPFSSLCTQANGWASCWAAFFASIYYAYYSWFQSREDSPPSYAAAGGAGKYEQM